MQIHFFSIPIHDGNEDAAELNRLLASHRIVDVQREFVSAGSQSSWQICVTTVSKTTSPSTDKKSRVDYREVLPTEDFAIFARLRSLRKEMAEKEGVPAYALFTNEQLADMTRRRVSSLNELKSIDGIGPTRIEKYGEAFVAELSKAPAAEEGKDGNQQKPPATLFGESSNHEANAD